MYFSHVSRPVYAQNQTRLKIPSTTGPTYVETLETSEMMATVSTLKPRSHRLKIPSVPKEWLENIKDQLPHGVLSDTGIIFGWGANTDYQVTLSHQNPNIVVIYFDENDEGSNNEWSVEKGSPDSYFLVFNVPLGFNNVIVKEIGGDVYGEAVFLESHNVSVVDASKEKIF